MLVAWADGGEVITAQGVQILPKEGTGFEPLRQGRQVFAGDLITMPPGSRFELKTKEGKLLRTPPQGLPKENKRPVIAMMISGASALMTRRPDIPPPLSPVPLDKIKRILESPWAHYGEGGIPLTDERRRAYQYPAEELNTENLRQRGLLPEQLRQKPKEVQHK